MLIGESSIPMPECVPELVLARGGPSVRLLRRLHDDVLWDVFMANTRSLPNVMRNARFLDAVRAELAVRHAPEEPREICSRCLYALDAHDELHQACPTEGTPRLRVAADASDSIGTLGRWDAFA